MKRFDVDPLEVAHMGRVPNGDPELCNPSTPTLARRLISSLVD